MALNPVEFNWKSEENSISKSLGFIAQDIEIVIPKLVSIDGNGNRELNTIGLIPVLTKGLQELASSTNELASSASELASKQDVISLTDRMDLAEAGIASSAIEIASISAQLLNLSISEATESALLTTAHSLTVEDELNVLGASTFSDISITGNITSGLLSIDGLNGSIQTLSEPLKLQQNALANLEVFGGKIILNTSGNIEIIGKLTAKEVETQQLNITGDKSSGSIQFEAGESEVIIGLPENTSENALFLVTPEEPVIVSAKRVANDSAEIRLKEASSSAIKVNWWVVGR